MQELSPYSIYENTKAFPRAFVVAKAIPLPERSKVLDALKATDFRQTVFLENYEAGYYADSGETQGRSVQIIDYQPNRVLLRLTPGKAGFLVLADVWFSGWTCSVDDQRAFV